MRHMIIASILLAALTAAAPAGAHQWCWNCNQQNTFGWQLMTPEERKEHQFKIQGLTDYTACKEYIDQHHKKMEERAVAKGLQVPLMQMTPCDEMKERGIFK